MSIVSHGNRKEFQGLNKVLPYLFNEPPWALIKVFDLESGHLSEAGRLLNFHHFQQV